jgi:DNA-binding NtrC family response regulator
LKILVAEDDDGIMTTYKVALRSRDHETFAASDGEECLRIFNDHFDQIRKQDADQHFRNSRTVPFDVVILDYRMPKKNGLEVAEQILSMAPQQRIIIASAYTNELKIPSNSQQSLELLQKPFELEDFLSVIERIQGGWSKKSGQKQSRNNQSSFDYPITSASLDDYFGNMSGSLDLFKLEAAVRSGL